MSETPLALPPTQMASTCGTVMSMVRTDKILKTLSSPVAGGESRGTVTAEQSAGSIVIASLLPNQGRPAVYVSPGPVS